MRDLPPIATAGTAVNPAVAELAAIPRWVCWRAIKRSDKVTKVPFTPACSQASSTDPRTWSSFDECWKAAFVDGQFDGVGFVLNGAGDLVGLDLDDCIKNGTVLPKAQAIVDQFASYAEITPSGTGLRIISHGSTPDPGRKNGKLEIYSAKRFLTITGQHLAGTPEQINGAQSAIDQLWAERFSKPRAAKNDNGSCDNGALPPYPNQDAIDTLLKDPVATSLWRQSKHAVPEDDPSPSGWDLAFAGYLARQGRSRDEIASYLRAYRRHHAPDKGKQDRPDYIWKTVDQALAEPTEPEQPKPTPSRQYNLAEVHEVYRRWLGSEYDFDVLNAVLATAAAERLPGDPVWLLVISGPGNAKTETVQPLSGAGALVTSTISSEGALLSATAKRERSKGATGGLMRKIGDRGLLVIKDVTSILSANRETRAAVLAALREIYDGLWERNVGTDGGRTLTWKGRIGLIGAVTTAWDRAHGVISIMGDRFVLIRADSEQGRLEAGRRAMLNVGHELEMRAELADAAGGLLEGARYERAEDLALTEDEFEHILRAADITTRARTGVEIDGRGKVEFAHKPEVPTRFAKQLIQLVRGAVAIGLDRAAALNLAIRCARDSMPAMRLAILEDLAAHSGSRPGDIRRRIDAPWTTVDREWGYGRIWGMREAAYPR